MTYIVMGVYSYKNICKKNYVSYPALIVGIDEDDKYYTVGFGHYLDEGFMKDFQVDGGIKKDDVVVENLLNRVYQVRKSDI